MSKQNKLNGMSHGSSQQPVRNDGNVATMVKGAVKLDLGNKDDPGGHSFTHSECLG